MGSTLKHTVNVMPITTIGKLGYDIKHQT